jgi:2-deoxy-D-gluconate 3-dehydrogenase
VSFRLDNYKTLVTGASRGIGRAIAIAYAEAGADVALLARDEAMLHGVAAEIEALGRRAIVLPADVTDADALRGQVAAAVDGLGGLDVVVNNAGGNSFMSPLATMRFSGWEKTQRLNVDSAVHVLQTAAPALMESGKASVINLSSFAGTTGVPLMSHYAAAKAAIISLSQSLAIEWAWTGVRVNALAPGWVDTDLTQFARDNDEAGKALIGRVPLGRWARVEEIAEPAVFLASSASSFMTGQTLVVDGGLSINP